MNRFQHLSVGKVLLMHEISQLLVMILQHLHRCVMDLLLHLRVLARIVDVVGVMMDL
jgi:hypothetical protein